MSVAFPIVDVATWMSYGADLGTMLTGVGVLGGVAVWTRGQVLSWRDRREARAYRTWHGYIMQGSVESWDVRLAERPDGVSGRVVLEVLGKDGEPSGNLANNMRIVAERRSGAHGSIVTGTPV